MCCHYVSRKWLKSYSTTLQRDINTLVMEIWLPNTNLDTIGVFGCLKHFSWDRWKAFKSVWGWLGSLENIWDFGRSHMLENWIVSELQGIFRDQYLWWGDVAWSNKRNGKRAIDYHRAIRRANHWQHHHKMVPERRRDVWIMLEIQLR